jgi:hypothetical protein
MVGYEYQLITDNDETGTEMCISGMSCYVGKFIKFISDSILRGNITLGLN